MGSARPATGPVIVATAVLIVYSIGGLFIGLALAAAGFGLIGLAFTLGSLTVGVGGMLAAGQSVLAGGIAVVAGAIMSSASVGALALSRA